MKTEDELIEEIRWIGFESSTEAVHRRLDELLLDLLPERARVEAEALIEACSYWGYTQ